MKGTLHYVSKDDTLVKSWVVWYNEQPDGGNLSFVDSLPLHPDDVNELYAWEQIGARIAINQEVEFDITIHEETSEHYAKLVHKEEPSTQYEDSKSIPHNETKEEFLPKATDSVFDFVCTTPDCPHCEEDRRQMEDDDYPEIEGTMAICNDMVSSKQISDHEIENLLRTRWGLSDELINACKWYREQTKQIK
jgi:hypothetical protein